MQSQGIGKILLNYAKDKRSKLYLNVYQKNARAISFYKREGFEIQHSGLDEATGERLCNDMATQIEIPVCRTDKIPLGTKGRTSILSVESSASCRASFPVSRRKLLDRACFVTSFRQGGYTPLRRLCVYPLWTCRPQTA